MSRVEKPKPLPVDPEAVVFEENRRADLQGNNAYQRGLVHAQETERRNVEGALQTALSDLKRVTLTRDVNTPGRDAYDRTWKRVTKAAERLASLLDNSIVDGRVIEGSVTIPAYLPAPTPAEVQTITIKALRIDGAYRETHGMGKSGTGGPGIPVPGSALDWPQEGGK